MKESSDVSGPNIIHDDNNDTNTTFIIDIILGLVVLISRLPAIKYANLLRNTKSPIYFVSRCHKWPPEINNRQVNFRKKKDIEKLDYNSDFTCRERKPKLNIQEESVLEFVFIFVYSCMFNGVDT